MFFQIILVELIGDGTFRPDDAVTYEQAIKMLICSIGYSTKAEELGGYPQGYVMIANQEGITSGTTNNVGGAKRESIAKLTFKALTVPMMDQISFGSTPIWERVDSMSLLFTKFNIIKADVKVIKISDDKEKKVSFEYTDIDQVAKNNGWCAKNGTITIGNKDNQTIELLSTVSIGDLDLKDFIGKKSNAYISIADEKNPALVTLVASN
jgi:hypothetical protein